MPLRKMSFWKNPFANQHPVAFQKDSSRMKKPLFNLTTRSDQQISNK
jgi:hypothetical protein